MRSRAAPVRPAPRPGTSGRRRFYGRPTTRIYNYYYYPRHYYPHGYSFCRPRVLLLRPALVVDSYPYYSGYSSYSYPAYAGGSTSTATDTRPARSGCRSGRGGPRCAWTEYYAGRVDDFDGFIQALRIEEGPHTIEIVANGYETLVFDVRIIAGRKIDYRGDMIPFRPC